MFLINSSHLYGFWNVYKWEWEFVTNIFTMTPSQSTTFLIFQRRLPFKYFHALSLYLGVNTLPEYCAVYFFHFYLTFYIIMLVFFLNIVVFCFSYRISGPNWPERGFVVITTSNYAPLFFMLQYWYFYYFHDVVGYINGAAADYQPLLVPSSENSTRGHV